MNERFFQGYTSGYTIGITNKKEITKYKYNLCTIGTICPIGQKIKEV